MGRRLATLAVSYVLLPTGMGSSPHPGHVAQLCDLQPRAGGRPCCGDTSEAHSDQCEAAGRVAGGQGRLGHLLLGQGHRGSPTLTCPPTHLLLAGSLPLALLYGHLQPQVIPAADPLLLFGPRRQAAGGIRVEARGQSETTPRPPPTKAAEN